MQKRACPLLRTCLCDAPEKTDCKHRDWFCQGLGERAEYKGTPWKFGDGGNILHLDGSGGYLTKLTELFSL